jgi:hypothetical protein
MKRGKRTWAIMAPIAALFVALTTVAVAAPAGSPARSSTSTQADRLRAIERTRLHALVEADMAVAARLHADDFQLINPAGFRLARDEYLAAVAAGDIDYLVFEPVSHIDVRLYGRAAVITYRSKIDIVVSGLGRLTHEAWHTYLYEHRHDGWQVVWEQATAVGGFPPA